MDEERWVAIDSALFSKFGKRFTVPKLKLKYNCLRKLHYDFAKLLAHTGMDWDPLTNKVHASEDIWESYIKRNPSAESFRKKGSYHHFHVLTEIFNDTFATGQTYCSSSTPCLHSDNKIELEAHMSPTSSSAETFIGGQGDTNKQRCCPVIFPADISMRTESRTSSLSKLDDVFEALTESVSARLEASLKVNCLKEQEASSSASSFRELASIEDCMDILEAIDGLEDVAYVRACEKFTSCDWRRMFVKMSEARKRMWLGSLK